MHFIPGELYHIYNRGNNKQLIFFNDDNYQFFLKKIRTHLLPFCDLLAHCLMPTHFHFLIHANENCTGTIRSGLLDINLLANSLRVIESSFAQAINKQNKRSGSLFQQNTKSKLLTSIVDSNVGIFPYRYPLICFN